MIFSKNYKLFKEQNDELQKTMDLTTGSMT